MSAHERVLLYLKENGCAFTVSEHEATTTSEASASVRGEPLRVGAKALFLAVTVKPSTSPVFHVAVLPASRKFDSKAFRKQVGGSKASVRFATEEELLQQTGLTKGCVPPMGTCIAVPRTSTASVSTAETCYHTFVDPAVLAPPPDFPYVCFNAASLQHSVRMPVAEYADKIVRAHPDAFTVVSISEPEPLPSSS
eukprot:ANDGO_05286.mRNA.1 Uncharacterized protein YeaK